MEKNTLQKVGGVLYYVSPDYTPDIEKHLKLIKDLELRDDDVICVGFPRTGNHWAHEVINMIMQQQAAFVEKTFYHSIMEFMGDSIYEKMEQLPSPRYLSTHHRVHTVPNQAVEKNIPIIYLMRNPKDALASMYVLMCTLASDNFRFQGTWEEFFELYITGKFIWGTWFDHVLAMEKFMKDHPQQRVYILLFEKMKEDPVGTIKELCKFLGKPDTLAQEIATITEFSNMKKVLKSGKLKIEEELFYQKGSDSLLRTGKTGGWKDRFTVAQSERFDKAFHEKLDGCKLADYVKHLL